jgi:tetratricopeptide (TPR) repeat protein/O-antigen ligase
VGRAAGIWGGFLVLWAGTLLWNGGVTVWGLPLSALATSLLAGAALLLLRDAPLRIGRGPWIWIHLWLALLGLHLLLPAYPALFPETARWKAAHGVSAWPASADAVYGIRFAAHAQAALLTALLVMKLRQAGLSTSAVLHGFLAVLGLEAAYGLVQQFAGLETIPFFGPRAAPDSASGTLVGRNNFGGLMAVALVLAAARAYGRFAWPLKRSEDSGKASWTRRLEGGLGWALLAALFAVAVVVSRSRGGAISALGGLLLLPVCLRARAGAAGLAGAGALLLVGVMIAHPRILLERFGGTDLASDARWAIAKETTSAALKQPVLGFGWGTHPTAFHPFQPPSMEGQIHHAHNEYVNVLFEAGLPGLIVLVAGLALWALRVWKAQKPLPAPDRLPLAAALAGLGVLVLHAFTDFDLRIPSIALLAGALVGLGAAAVRDGVPRPGWPPVLLGLLFSGLAAAANRLPDPAATETEARRVLRWSPYDARAAWVLARRTGDPVRLETAADLFPAHPDLQREAGLIFRDNGRPEAAARCLRRLFEQRPNDVAAVLAEALEEGVPTGELEGLLPAKAPARAAFASELVRRGRWKEGVDFFSRHVPGRAEHAPLFDAFADRLRDAGQWGLEAGIRDRRLSAASDAPAHAAAALAWSRLGVHDEALKRIVTAARIDPTRAEWDGLRGALLAAKGERRAAVDAYTAARSKDPATLEWTLRRGLLLLEDRTYGAAADDLKDVLRSDPAHRTARLGLARAEAALGRKESARIQLEEWLGRNPGDAEAKALLESLRN